MLGRDPDAESNASSGGENGAVGSEIEADESKSNGKGLKPGVEGSKIPMPAKKSVGRKYSGYQVHVHVLLICHLHRI